MIELIFVIVIIGILSSVAMVKITANRDDAIMILGISNVKQVIRDLSGYYIAKGEFGTWQEMTNVKLDNTGNNKNSRYEVENQKCIVFRRKNAPGSILIRINNKGYTKSSICQSISNELIKQNITSKGKGITHMLGGTSTN